MPATQVIHIHVQAPAKPAEGALCNGCGVCCLAQPCPLGAALSGRRSGACSALRWDSASTRYHCGAVTTPHAVLRACLPGGFRWMAAPLSRVLPWLARRWIAAGTGCDSSLLPQSTEPLVVGHNPTNLPDQH